MTEVLLMALGGALAVGLDHLLYGVSHGVRMMRRAPRAGGVSRAKVRDQQQKGSA